MNENMNIAALDEAQHTHVASGILNELVSAASCNES